jgi:hypothetical protein
MMCYHICIKLPICLRLLSVAQRPQVVQRNIGAQIIATTHDISVAYSCR